MPATSARLTSGIFSSRSDEWYTPQALVSALAKRYAKGTFSLDRAGNLVTVQSDVAVAA